MPGKASTVKPAPFDLHQAAGGTAGWQKLAAAFYARVDRDPLLRPLFPGRTLRCAIEEFTAFLAQFSGGPSQDTQRRWWLSLRESHLRFRIRREERAAWMKNMVDALDDVEIDEPLRAGLREFFLRSSAYVVNSGTIPADAAETGESNGDPIRQQIARRWEAQRALDDAAAAVRTGDSARAIGLAEGAILQARFERDRAALAGLLALIIAGGDRAMLSYARRKIAHDPALVRERYAGRTLLHEASARGELTVVELLLQLGADPNARDGGAHTPLYCLANEYHGSEGGSVVHALARSGADVNANDGAKRCTPLHMAARRGHAQIAAALLDCGAAIEARDSLGDTPLRRSVNCGRPQVARLLLARGADAHSKGSKGLTPLAAARTSAMKQILGSRQ